VREVAGSCFCCNFNALIDAATGLNRDIHADVLIGEPVGSCTDLSATILQPLKARYAQAFALAPLSVLADPARIEDFLAGTIGGLHADAAYIYGKQLEEADIIVVNKADLLTSEQRARLRDCLAARFPGRGLRFISALTGEGVDDWLDGVLAGGASGARITDVDYDRYARGEAVLGWLNATCDLTAVSAAETVDWQDFCRRLLESFKEEFARRAAAIGHVKIILSTAHGTCAGNLTRTDAPVAIGGRLNAPSPAARLVVNARVEMSPESLETIVRGTIQQTAHDWAVARIDHLRSLSPGRPVPTHRFTQII
jgi:hypothetical protein